MRLSLLLSTFIGAALLASALCGGLTVWSLERSARWNARIDLAQTSYSEHQKLQSDIYRLFKEYADAFLIGNRDQGTLESEIEAEIAATIERIREGIAREIEFDGEEELEELRLLSTLERKIGEVLESYHALWVRSEAPELRPPQQQLAQLLDQQIDRDLSDLIAIAIAGEREEVEATRAAAASFRRNVEIVAVVLVILSFLVSALAARRYRDLVHRPLASLMEGVVAYRRGEFARPIVVRGAVELGQLAETLSGMGKEIASREAQLTDHARELERAVRERTSELQHLLTRFEEAEANRRRMMADVSHELRTPLTIIQGEAEVSLRGRPKEVETYLDALSRIRDAARHSNRIVDDLLMISREESGHLRLDLRRIDLNEAVAEAAGLVAAPVNVEALDRPAGTRADPLRLRQSLLAVLNNAIRYGGTSIVARVERRPKSLAVVVEDDGPGMTEAEKAQAFDRFYRGPSAQGSGVEGTGLGLPIVRSIMRAHGGSAELDNREGGGLRVSLVLPEDSLFSVVQGEEPRQIVA